MIIWSGWGFLVAVIVFGASLSMELATESLFEDDRYYQTHAWPVALALALAGVIVWILGNHLHARGARIVVDKTTGQELTIATHHTFFFIPMRHWGLLLLALSILPFFLG